MKKEIKKPLDELEELIPALLSIVSLYWNNRKTPEIIFKVFMIDKETKLLSNQEKDLNFCFLLIKSYLNNSTVVDTSNIDLFRVKVDSKNIEVFFKDKEDYSSFYFNKDALLLNIRDSLNQNDKEIENNCVNRIIDILK